MTTVQKKPSKPMMIWDSDCRFCSRWIDRWHAYTGDQVEYKASLLVAEEFPEIPKAAFGKSVQFIETNGAVYAGAEAVFRALAYSPSKKIFLKAYQRIGLFRSMTEWGYRFIADRRSFFSKVTQWLWGTDLSPATYFISSTVFIKGLALIYLFAMGSMVSQALPLFGSQGLAPASEHLRLTHDFMGWKAYLSQPTLFWINSSDWLLLGLGLAGMLAAIMAILGTSHPAYYVLCWLIYLSYVNIGQEFTSFQWDSFLLEVGFLAIFFLPWKKGGFLKMFSWQGPPIIKALTSWLIFRLMFFSGAVKLRSGDESWRDLSALEYHFQTQPLPTWLGWHLHHSPDWVLRVSAGLVLAIELLCPFLMFLPNRIRRISASLMILLQVLILLTGNYGFFNLLTIVVLLLLIDDRPWGRFFQSRINASSENLVFVPKKIQYAVLAICVIMTSGQLASIPFPEAGQWPKALQPVRSWLKPLHFFNHYGLFAIMTTERPEIVIEGSYNRIGWEEYEFHFKPGDTRRRPSFNLPHQPRLDWQMWFAAITPYQENRWISKLSENLLRGNPKTLKWFKKNPFPDSPPRYLRFVSYRYEFTDRETKNKTGEWWVRQRIGTYMPVVSLKNR